MSSQINPPEPEHQTFNVGVKALVVRGNQVLLLRRRDYSKWEIPGGRINEGEDARQTLVRELHEELPGTANVRIGKLVHAEQTDFLLPNGRHLMLLFFRVTAKLPSPLTFSSEHAEVRWASLEDIPTLLLQKPILTAVCQALATR